MRWAAILLAAAALFGGRPALAHGVWTEVGRGAATTVTVRADDGGPLVGAAFSVRPPGEDRAFAAGVTDAGGRLVFRPDRPGTWRVKIAGAGGHGTVVTIDITPEALAGKSLVTAAAHLHTPGSTGEESPAEAATVTPSAPPGRAAVPSGSSHLRGVAGAALLLGLVGTGFLLLRRRAGRRRSVPSRDKRSKV